MLQCDKRQVLHFVKPPPARVNPALHSPCCDAACIAVPAT